MPPDEPTEGKEQAQPLLPQRIIELVAVGEDGTVRRWSGDAAKKIGTALNAGANLLLEAPAEVGTLLEQLGVLPLPAGEETRPFRRVTRTHAQFRENHRRECWLAEYRSGYALDIESVLPREATSGGKAPTSDEHGNIVKSSGRWCEFIITVEAKPVEE